MLSKSLIAWFKRTLKNPFVIAFFIGIASLHLVKEMSLARRSAPLPLVAVGSWSLTNDLSEAFGSKELQGKVYIANFFFTRCPTICPKLIADMKEVRKRFEKDGDKIHFVSFTVDPEFDSPSVLREYRLKAKINDSNWVFLTGSTSQLINVVMNQMKLHVGDKESLVGSDPADELFNISHAAEFVLFDQNGDIRDKFATDSMGLAALVRSAKFLLEKGPNG